jgi:hypothetical protein
MALWETIQGLGAAAGGLAYAGKISDKGDTYAKDMGTLAGELADDAAFKGYGVTTGLGTSSVESDGSISLGVGPNGTMGLAGQGAYNTGLSNANKAQTMLGANSTNPYAQQAMTGMGNSMTGVAEMQGGAFGAQNQFMNQSMQGTAGREQDIYNRAMAMQQPGLDQQRAQGNANEYKMGRGGVMGSQFGGSGEDAAMARAQAGAQNQAAFQAMGQASQEQMQQAQMSNMFGQQGMQGAGFQQGNAMGMAGMGMQQAQLGQSAGQAMGGLAAQQAQMGMSGYQNQYLPMQQQLNAMGVAQNTANMAQTGQLTGAGYGAQLGLGSIQTQVNADKAASELYGNVTASIMNNANAGEDASWLGGLFGSGGLFGGGGS